MEDVERKQRRFHLRSSRSNSREVPDSPLSPRPMAMEPESSVCKERFVPPELSIWDYFIAKVFLLFFSLVYFDTVVFVNSFVCPAVKPYLPSSVSRVEYDSEESQGSEDEEEDDDDDEDDGDSFDPNSPLAEHSNNNSYR